MTYIPNVIVELKHPKVAVSAGGSCGSDWVADGSRTRHNRFLAIHSFGYVTSDGSYWYSCGDHTVAEHIDACFKIASYGFDRLFMVIYRSTQRGPASGSAEVTKEHRMW